MMNLYLRFGSKAETVLKFDLKNLKCKAESGECLGMEFRNEKNSSIYY